MDYQSYVNSVANIALVSPVDPTYVSFLPDMINYAELRIYRDLDLLETRTRDYSNSLTANSRNFTVPSQFVVVEGLNVITPSTAATPDAGTRNTLAQVSREFLDIVWPVSTAPTTPSVPEYVAQINQTSYIVGPPPDAAYLVEVVGTIRPAPLSATNTTTFLTTWLPDMFLAASMCYMAGFQRDFGAQSDDPRTGLSWEALYQQAYKNAGVEELRKKWASTQWSSKQPNPIVAQDR